MNASKYVVVVVVFVLILVNVSPADMLITGVIDGPLTDGLPKAIELYVLEDIPDLSIYGLGCANNGGGSDGQEFTFDDNVANAGQFIYVSKDSLGFADFFGFGPDTTSNVANFNGDDAIELYKNSSVFDVFGDVNKDGTGEPWEYIDGWAYRLSGTGPDGSSFQVDHWTFSGPNALDDETTNATAEKPFPLGTYEPNPIAIDLISFTATLEAGEVVLRWHTAAGVNSAGFFVHRAGPYDECFTCISRSMIPAKTEGTCGSVYVYNDQPTSMGTVRYKLEHVELDGRRSFFGPISISPHTTVADKESSPRSARLAAHPNPFNSTTTFKVTLKQADVVTLSIYNVVGKQIRSFATQHWPAGTHFVVWDGTTDWNTEAPSGLYLAKLITREQQTIFKLTLLR